MPSRTDTVIKICRLEEVASRSGVVSEFHRIYAIQVYKDFYPVSSSIITIEAINNVLECNIETEHRVKYHKFITN